MRSSLALVPCPSLGEVLLRRRAPSLSPMGMLEAQHVIADPFLQGWLADRVRLPQSNPWL